MKNVFNRAVFFAICAALFFAFASCSNGSDGGSSAPAVTTEGTNTGGGGTTQTDNGSQSGGSGTGGGGRIDPAVDHIDAHFINIKSGIVNGSVRCDWKSAKTGETVPIRVEPASGYKLGSLTVTTEEITSTVAAALNASSGLWEFTMPSACVTVNATFVLDSATGSGTETGGGGQSQSASTKYTVTISTGITNGSVTSDKTSAAKGETVKLTVTPMSGYGFATLIVATYGGTSVTVNGTSNERSFAMPANNVTVTATFIALPPAVSGDYLKTGTTTIDGKQYDLVTFGLWPQTIKAANVMLNERETKNAGDFIYCRGNDGQWYVKIKENPYYISDKYSDGTGVTSGAFNSYKWFKVEPIKWRVLTKNYNGTGKKLLLAENILIAKRYDASKNNYQKSEMRKWLNSNVNSNVASDYGNSNGFLKTAFSSTELAIIEGVSVDNSTRSAFSDNDVAAQALNNGNNQYAINMSTTDKVFLLSEREATKKEFGFDDSIISTECNALIRQTTDCAKASGAYQDQTNGKGGWWWLRSPFYDRDINEFMVGNYGAAAGSGNVDRSDVGVVPALCLE